MVQERGELGTTSLLLGIPAFLLSAEAALKTPELQQLAAAGPSS